MKIPWILFFAFTLSETVVSAPVLPAVAEHWKIELLAEDAVSRGPTAVVETPARLAELADVFLQK